MKVNLKSWTVLIIGAVALIAPVLAFAQTIGPTIPTSNQVFSGGLEGVRRVFGDPQMLVANIFKIAIAISGAIFLVMFLVGGLRYLMSAGDEENTGKAKKVLVDSIIGLLIVLAAWAAGTWILGKLGLGSETSVSIPGGTGTGGITPGGGGGSDGTTTGGEASTNLAYKAGYRDGLNCGVQGRDQYDCFSPNSDPKYDINQYKQGYDQGYNVGIKDATINPGRPSDKPNFVYAAPPILITDFTDPNKRKEIDDRIKEFSEKCARVYLGTPKVNWEFPSVILECYSKYSR